MNAALRVTGRAAGDGFGEFDEIVGIVIRDCAYHHRERQDRGRDQAPVAAASGSVRIIHRGWPVRLKYREAGDFSRSIGPFQPVLARLGTQGARGSYSR